MYYSLLIRAGKNQLACIQCHTQRQERENHRTPVISHLLLSQNRHRSSRAYETRCREHAQPTLSKQNMEEQTPKPTCWHMVPTNRFRHPCHKIIFCGLSVLKDIAIRLES